MSSKFSQVKSSQTRPDDLLKAETTRALSAMGSQVEVYLECVRGVDPDDSYRSPACRSIAVSGLVTEVFTLRFGAAPTERRLWEINLRKI